MSKVEQAKRKRERERKTGRYITKRWTVYAKRTPTQSTGMDRVRERGSTFTPIA